MKTGWFYKDCISLEFLSRKRKTTRLTFTKTVSCPISKYASTLCFRVKTKISSKCFLIIWTIVYAHSRYVFSYSRCKMLMQDWGESKQNHVFGWTCPTKSINSVIRAFTSHLKVEYQVNCFPIHRKPLRCSPNYQHLRHWHNIRWSIAS